MQKFIKNSKALIFLLVFSACGEIYAESLQSKLAEEIAPSETQLANPTKNNKVVFHGDITRNEICDPDNVICIDTYTKEGITQAILKNKSFGSRTVEVYIWNKNMSVKTHVDDLKKISLAGKEVKDLLTFTVIDPTQSYGHNFNFNSTKGFIDATHNDSFVYTLPFETGKNYKLVQGYGGSFSHKDSENYYSYDFKMPPGETVTAARGGTIIEVEESYKIGGSKRNLINKSNYIYVQHDDGTIGIYSHLSHNGAIVRVGDKVQQGQDIGISGATGYINGSHLHFSIGKYLKDERLQSLPIKIKTQKGVETNLESFVDYYK